MKTVYLCRAPIIIFLSILSIIFSCTIASAAGITIGNGASVTLSGSPTVTTVDMTITGTLSGGAGAVNISGNWSRTGTLTPGTCTVEVVGTGTSVINNSNTFYNFMCRTPSKTVTFEASATQTITNALTLNGQAAGTRIVLRSATSGTQWKIDPQGTLTVQYVDVKDSNNESAVNPTIAPSFTMDSGNNQDWNFGSISISGSSSFIVGVQAGPFTVDITYTNSNTANRDIIVDLSSDSAGTHEFRDTSGGPAVTSVVVPAGSTSTIFYYVDNAVGSPTVTASTIGYTSGTITLTVSNVTFQVVAQTPQIAGKPFTLTITAKDDTGATATGYAGTVNITVNYINPGTGTGVLSVTSTSAFVAGVATIANETFSDCGTITIKVTDASTPAITGTSANVVFAPFNFTVVLSGLDSAASGDVSGIHIVAKSFTMEVRALNAQGAACPNYKGNALVSINYIDPSGDQSGTLSVATLGSGNWAGGISSVATQSFDRWGKISIKVTDATLTTQTGTSDEVFFVPKDLQVTLSSIPASRTFYYANESFSVTVIARDFNDQAIVNYQGTVTFSGVGLNLPASYTFTLEDAGVHIFSGVNGSRQIDTAFSATDTEVTSVTGESSTISLKTGTIKVISTSGPVGPVRVEVNLVDSDGNLIESDDSTVFTVVLSEFIADNSASSDAVGAQVSISGGTATITVIDDSAEVVTVTPAAIPELTYEAGTVTFGTLSGSGLGIQLWREIRSDEKE